MLTYGVPCYFVKSSTEENVQYFVDLSGGVCTCPVGMYGKMCKHQKAVIIHFQLASTFLYTATPEEKCFWAHVAVGEKLSKDPNYFFKYEESEIHGVEVASANPCCSKSLSPPPLHS